MTPSALTAEQYGDIDALRARDRDTAIATAADAARRLPFYAEKFEGIDVAATPFEELPLTAKSELRHEQEQHPPFGRLVPSPDDVIQAHMSSGSTGRPLYVPVTRADVALWARSFGRVMSAAGLGAGDVCIQGFAMSRAFGGGLPLVQFIQMNEVAMIPIGAEAGSERMLRAIRDIRPTAMIGTPHFLLYLAEKAEEVIGEQLNTLLSLKGMIVGGEPGAPALRPRLEELWGGRMTEMFGSSEALPSGCWHICEHGDSLHFCGQGITYIEVLDSTGGSLPLEAGVQGELIYSDLAERTGLRLMRYRCGDVVTVTDTECPCGRTGPKIRVTGRVDDTLIIRGINVMPSSVQEAIARFAPVVSGRMQIQWTEEGYTTQQPIALDIERGDAPIEDEVRLAEALTQAVKAQCNCAAVVRLVPFESLKPEDDKKVALVARVGVGTA
jgi:phenylacetate-CoA ligase